MFRVLSLNGYNVVFDQHKNKKWKVTAERAGERFELSRSVSPQALPSVVNCLMQKPEDFFADQNFTQLSRKVKSLIKQIK